MGNREISDNTIILGDLADTFFKSDLGRYAISRANEEVERYTEELKGCDPYDHKRINSLQTDIRVAEKALIWIGEALKAGREELQIRMDNDD